MHEIEIKLQVPPARAEAVRRAVAGPSGATRQRLQAAYFDTADRALANAGLALRLRREGRRWVQALKGAGPDGLTRLEHEVPRGGAAAMPALDLSLHVGTPAGERLAAVLADPGHGSPQLVFRTDIRRTSRRTRVQGGQVELAFDEGRIVAGDRALAVCELEIELLAGTPAAVLGSARRWIERHGLWIDLRSKAERGDALARGVAVSPERKAQPVVLAPDLDAAAARRVVIASCLDQVAVNASIVAGGVFLDEHVHQLRVGLRRLRSAMRLFDGRVPEGSPGEALAATMDSARALFRALGASRDQAAVGGPLQRALRDALAAVGLAFDAPALPAADDATDPTRRVRARDAQALLIDLFEMVQPGAGAPASDAPDGRTAGADAAPLRPRLADRLNRWHRQISADAGRFATLDDAARHRLRKRAKRLRYAVEFSGALFGAKAVRRYLEPLRELQERLGALNDVNVALAAFRAVENAACGPGVVFTLGWLAARRDARIAEAVPALQRFAKAKRFWR